MSFVLNSVALMLYWKRPSSTWFSCRVWQSMLTTSRIPMNLRYTHMLITIIFTCSLLHQKVVANLIQSFALALDKLQTDTWRWKWSSLERLLWGWCDLGLQCWQSIHDMPNHCWGSWPASSDACGGKGFGYYLFFVLLISIHILYCPFVDIGMSADDLWG
jgi:hypothetical protein